MNHFTKKDGFNAYRLPVAWQFLETTSAVRNCTLLTLSDMTLLYRLAWLLVVTALSTSTTMHVGMGRLLAKKVL